MSERRTLAVVDGQTIYRTGLVTVLERLGYRVGSVAACWDDHIDQSAGNPVDLVVVNVAHQTDAFATIAWICEQQRVPVLTLAAHNDTEGHFRAVKAGSRGLVDIDADERTLGAALHDMFTAGIHCNHYMEAYLHSAGRVPGPAPVAAGQLIDELTDRELQVLRWLLHTPRLTLARIGKRLNIDRCSVASHEKNICAKLGVCGREGLLQFVWSHNISLDSLKRRSKHQKRIRPPSRSGPPGRGLTSFNHR